MTIKINDREYKVKQTLRSIFLWEQISERTFEIKTTLDNYLYLYCILLANNEDFMTWDEFIDTIDDNPVILVEMTKAMTYQSQLEKLLNPDNADGAADKKKD